jgi:EmrB/QacA subfamily drug resistance transporter
MRANLRVQMYRSMADAPDPDAPDPDPRRWFAAAVVIVSVAIPVLDNTVLNVAIPTILREFHTDLPSLQWVITGYSLTFATFLIIGGRLGDMYGHRRMFIVGAAIFGAGSFLASVSHSVPTLILGEAIIEGIGASLLLPATLSILSTTFQGAERAVAFAAWGTVAGASVAFGPLVGGFLTTNYSWRWSLRINVIVAPLFIIGALLLMRRDRRPTRRPSIDLPGAAMIATGSFALVFALSEAATYGVFRPLRDFSIAGRDVWPADRAISIAAVAFLAAVVILASFYAFERAKERRDGDPLFEFSQLKHLGFRYGLQTTMVLAMGQFGFLLVVPVLLQDGQHFTALRAGAYMVPMGALIALGAPLGARLTRVIGTTRVVRIGLVLEAVGLVLVALMISTHTTLLALFPGSALFGIGVGFASSQLTNVILSDIDKDKAGVASGTNTTVRQVGAALGIAVIGSLLNAHTIKQAIRSVHAITLPHGVETATIARIRAQGVNFTPPPGTPREQAIALARALERSVVAGARPALLFAAGVVTLGAFLSLLIPNIGPLEASPQGTAEAAISAFESVDVEPVT